MIPKKVLLVDDSPLIVERLISILDHLRLQTLLSCGTAFEAKQFFVHMDPDIVVLDIHLPDGSGIDLLETVKQKKPDTLVIMLTNQTGPYYRKLCTALGADHFLDKSTDFEQVPEIIVNS